MADAAGAVGASASVVASEELAAVLDEQADLVVSGCRHANPLPSDLERVVAKRGSSSGIGDRPRP